MSPGIAIPVHSAGLFRWESLGLLAYLRLACMVNHSIALEGAKKKHDYEASGKRVSVCQTHLARHQ